MRANYVLIDYENVQASSLERLIEPHFHLRVFLGPNNTRLPTELAVAVHRLRERADYILLDTPGANALDFHIAYYLGQLASADPTGFFHIISRDKGFDPLLKHLKNRGISALRSASIEDMPCFKALCKASVQPDRALVAVTHEPKPQPVQKTLIKEPVSNDLVVKAVIADLIGRKASKPKTIKTLLSTIHSKVGKSTPIEKVESIYATLRQHGYVKESGKNVSYSLPTACGEPSLMASTRSSGINA
ncbi:PIN domain-containing protein [Stutzerimonas chloritidismutans]|uniref:PIN domain-containing protein n=1 Tax=Stutzerimonas chloritidismutans TaxID=203192 RepID=UPI003F13592E